MSSTRLTRITLVCALAAASALPARAEYIVLRSGQRLHVTGYQLQDGKYLLQLSGGTAEVPAEQVTGVEPEEVFVSTPPAKPPASAPYRDLVETAATRYHVDADLISSVIAVESNFDPKAVSRKNARGLMQLLPATAAKLGVKNAFDPEENIDAGTRYLSGLLHQYGNNLVLALAAYNAGPQKIQIYGRVPPYAETVSYVRRVKAGYEKRKQSPPAKSKETLAIESLR